jgi:transcriptional regulator with XRE-family HTH domain
VGTRNEAETLVALNDGSMSAPRVTSDGIARVLRSRAEFPGYMVEMTPDPRLAIENRCPIPAEAILDALKAAGFSVRGGPRSDEARTHEALAELTGIHRRTISRICSGKRPTLTVDEAEAILDAIDRSDLWHQLVGAHLEEQDRLDEAVGEIYEEWFTVFRSHPLPIDEWRAIADAHLLHEHTQRNSELAFLPDAQRRATAVAWFEETYGRPPAKATHSLRERALGLLAERREQYVAAAERAEKEIGPPERITASYVRDLTRRARARGLIGADERTRGYTAAE